MPTIKAKNIEKYYQSTDGEQVHALKDISLTVEDGEFVAIVGPSGCGKSTFLEIVAGLLPHDGGEVYLDDQLITETSREIGVVFQDASLFPWRTIKRNIAYGMELAKVPKEEQEKRATHYLKMVGLLEYKNYPIHQISGGMRQRTALARALAMDSKILLMDEPFSALDKQTSNQLRAELQKIWIETHKTILFITHSVEESVYLADRVVVLSPKTGSVTDIVDINIPRPREVYSPEFVELRHKILDEVKGENTL